MDPSTSMSVENRVVDQRRAFIDETTAEAVEAKNKFTYQEDLVNAFNGDATAVGYTAAVVRADKFEARHMRSDDSRPGDLYAVIREVNAKDAAMQLMGTSRLIK